MQCSFFPVFKGLGSPQDVQPQLDGALARVPAAQLLQRHGQRRDGETGCQQKQAKGKRGALLPSARSWQRRRRHPRQRQLPPLSLPRDNHKHHRRGPKRSVQARQDDHAHLTRSWSYGGGKRATMPHAEAKVDYYQPQCQEVMIRASRPFL